jgi:hypothetical protein
VRSVLPDTDEQLSPLELASRHDLHVREVYSALIDGSLKATLAFNPRDTLTVSALAAAA